MKTKLTKTMFWAVGTLVLVALSAVGYKSIDQKATSANLDKARNMIAENAEGQGCLA